MSIDLKQFMTSQPKALSSESWYIASPYSHENDAVVEERVAAAIARRGLHDRKL